MSKTDAPILELSTLAPDRPEILLHWTGEPDGKLYEMITIDDLDLDQQADLAKYSEIMRDLQGRARVEEITPPEMKKLAAAIGKLVKYLIPSLEDQAFAELADGAKVKIIEAFMLASPDLMAAVEAKEPTETSASQ